MRNSINWLSVFYIDYFVLQNYFYKQTLRSKIVGMKYRIVKMYISWPLLNNFYPITIHYHCICQIYITWVRHSRSQWWLFFLAAAYRIQKSLRPLCCFWHTAATVIFVLIISFKRIFFHLGIIKCSKIISNKKKISNFVFRKH